MAKIQFLLVLLACSAFHAGASIPDNDDPFGLDGVTRIFKIGVGMGYRIYKELSKPESIDEITETLTKVAHASTDEKGFEIFEPIVDKVTKTIKEVSGEPLTDNEMDELLERLRNGYKEFADKSLNSFNLLADNKYILKSYAKKVSQMMTDFADGFMKSANLPLDPMMALKMFDNMHYPSQHDSPKSSAPTTSAPMPAQAEALHTSESNTREQFTKFLLGLKTPSSTDNNKTTIHANEGHSKLKNLSSDPAIVEENDDDENPGDLLKDISQIFGGGTSEGVDLKHILQDKQLQDVLKGLLGN